MKIKTKRFLSFALAFMLLLGCLPAGVWTTHVHADDANTLTLPFKGLSVTYADDNQNGTSSWSTNGVDTITGTATGAKKGNNTFRKKTTLTFTNTLDDEANISFSWKLTDYFSLKGSGKVSGVVNSSTTTNSGTYSGTISAKKSITITLESPRGESTDTLSITSIMFYSNASGNVAATFLPVEGGSYTVDGEQVTAQTVKENPATTKYTLVATAADDYLFQGWYNVTTDKMLSGSETYEWTVLEAQTIKPIFIPNTTAMFGVSDRKFTDLTEAGTYAASTTKKITLLNSGTLTKGDYVVPDGVTLVIPFDANATVYTEAKDIGQKSDGILVTLGQPPKDWETPYAYRLLTMPQGSSITFQGSSSLNVAGKHSAGDSSGQTTAGSPSGALGMIKMETGSSIVMEKGSTLYCWGYIYGDGTVTAKAGAAVHENFQFTDFRGGNASADIVNASNAVFPLSQYYVQNVEVALTLEYGSIEYLWSSTYALKSIQATGKITFIGEGGMFNPANGGSVTKRYDPTTDRLIVDFVGGGEINPLSLTIANVPINSESFHLPLNSNITINVKSGTLTVKQSLAMLPGSKLTIDKGATAVLAAGNSPAEDYYAGGHNAFIYDRDEWFYAYTQDGTRTEGKFVHSNCRLRTVKYSPSGKYQRTETDLVDAIVDINGTLLTEGYAYTTKGGACVISSEKTGKVIMQNEVGWDTKTYQANQGSDVVFLDIPVESIMLKNGDDTFTHTATYSYDDDDNLVPTSTSCQNKWHYDAATVKWVAEHKYGSNGLCEECNHVNGYNGEDVYFAGWTLTLDGTIGMNYYVMLSNDFVNSENAYISFTGVEKLNGEYRWYVKDGVRVKDGVNYFKITIPVCAYEMNKIITAEATFGGDTVKCNASVRNYAESMISGNYTEDDKKFAAALLNYGAASQTYFSESEKRPELADDLANINLGDKIDQTILNKSELESFKKTPETNDSIGTFKGFNLSLGSQTALRAYFDLADGVTAEDLVFTVNGESATYENGRIECAGINAKELGEDIVFKVTLKSDSTKTLEFSCSAMSYCYSALENSNNNSLKVLVSALYRYYQASLIYYN